MRPGQTRGLARRLPCFIECGNPFRRLHVWTNEMHERMVGSLRHHAKSATSAERQQIEWVIERAAQRVPNRAEAARLGVIHKEAATVATEPAPMSDVLARIAALENRPELAYRDVWDAAVVFPANSAVTHSGCLWICKSENIGQQPGWAKSPWRLAVKRGRDSRDAKRD